MTLNILPEHFICTSIGVRQSQNSGCPRSKQELIDLTKIWLFTRKTVRNGFMALLLSFRKWTIFVYFFSELLPDARNTSLEKPGLFNLITMPVVSFWSTRTIITASDKSLVRRITFVNCFLIEKMCISNTREDDWKETGHRPICFMIIFFLRSVKAMSMIWKSSVLLKGTKLQC